MLRVLFKLARTPNFCSKKTSLSLPHVSEQYLHTPVITSQSRGLHLLGRKEWELEPVMFPPEGVGMLKLVAHVYWAQNKLREERGKVRSIPAFSFICILVYQGMNKFLPSLMWDTLASWYTLAMMYHSPWTVGENKPFALHCLSGYLVEDEKHNKYYGRRRVSLCTSQASWSSKERGHGPCALTTLLKFLMHIGLRTTIP